MDTGLKDKHVLITGASGGIGQSAAHAFSAEGTRLSLHYHLNKARAEELGTSLTTDAVALRADLREETQVDRIFAQSTKALGNLDGVVVNAGIWPAADESLHEMSLERWRGTLDADLTSAFLTCRAYMRHVAETRPASASIVLIGSTAAMVGEAGHADYAAAKAAMTYGLTRTLKNEIVALCPRGRVNCVCPGWTATPMSSGSLQDQVIVDRATSTMALRKIAQPEDMAGAIVFLTSDVLAGHITGAILPVSGGMEGRVIHPG